MNDKLIITRPDDIRKCIQESSAPIKALRAIEEVKELATERFNDLNALAGVTVWKRDVDSALSKINNALLRDDIKDKDLEDELDRFLFETSKSFKKLHDDIKQITEDVGAVEEFDSEIRLRMDEQREIHIRPSLLVEGGLPELADLELKLQTRSNLNFFNCLIGDDFTDLIAAKTIFGEGI